jgi:hypothetical protein
MSASAIATDMFPPIPETAIALEIETRARMKLPMPKRVRIKRLVLKNHRSRGILNSKYNRIAESHTVPKSRAVIKCPTDDPCEVEAANRVIRNTLLDVVTVETKNAQLNAILNMERNLRRCLVELELPFMDAVGRWQDNPSHDVGVAKKDVTIDHRCGGTDKKGLSTKRGGSAAKERPCDEGGCDARSVLLLAAGLTPPSYDLIQKHSEK